MNIPKAIKSLKSNGCLSISTTPILCRNRGLPPCNTIALILLYHVFIKIVSLLNCQSFDKFRHLVFSTNLQSLFLQDKINQVKICIINIFIIQYYLKFFYTFHRINQANILHKLISIRLTIEIQNLGLFTVLYRQIRNTIFTKISYSRIEQAAIPPSWS